MTSTSRVTGIRSRAALILVGVTLSAPALGAQGRGQDALRVSAEVMAGTVGGAVGGIFGAAGGQTIGEVLPWSPSFWTFVATVALHNTGTTVSTAMTYRVIEGRRALYSDARKGAMIGDAALLTYAALVSPLLGRVGCGVGTWCGKGFGIAAHLLPAIGATIAIERAR